MKKFRAAHSYVSLPDTKRICLATALWLTADNCSQSHKELFRNYGEERVGNLNL